MKGIRGVAMAMALAVSAPGLAAQTPERDAARAMQAWAEMIDARRYQESWEAASPLVRERVPAAAWATSLRQARGPFGAVASRTLDAAVHQVNPPGAPAGEYVRLRFLVSFAGGASAIETVVAARDGEAWRAAGYFMAPAPAQRPDYAAPAGAPYTAQEVSVDAGTHRLAGTLTLPNGARGPVPAVVLITGSGAQDRDAMSPLIPDYRFFRQVADTLSRRGIAVLRVDDRGWGGSGGDVQSATTASFADDIRAAVAFLRGRAEVDPARIALAGHSEGGIIAPLVAADDPRIGAVVLLAAPSQSGRRILDYQLRDALAGQGLAGAALDSAFAAGVAERDSLAGQVPWIRWFMDHDPLPTVRRVRVPVLILHGESDRQVTAEQAPELQAALRDAGNRSVTARVFPGLNHLFLRDPQGTADPARYAALPDKRVPPEVLGALADWLVATLAR